MSTRDAWLETGLAVLGADGFRAVTIDRLCREMNLSKGSFYHHFGGVPGFETALLERFEYDETQRYVEVAESTEGWSARDRLDYLRHAAIAGPDDGVALEQAVRAWAAQDPGVRLALERVDQLRLGYLETLLHEITGSRDEARDVARMIYLVLLGAFHVLPPVSMGDVARLWERIVEGL